MGRGTTQNHLFGGHGGDVRVWWLNRIWTLRPASEGVYVSMIASASIKKWDKWPDFNFFGVADFYVLGAAVFVAVLAM